MESVPYHKDSNTVKDDAWNQNKNVSKEVPKKNALSDTSIKDEEEIIQSSPERNLEEKGNFGHEMKTPEKDDEEIDQSKFENNLDKKRDNLNHEDEVFKDDAKKNDTSD